MARIKGKDLYLKDDDQIYFGDNQEAAIWYDEGTELRLNHTISGVSAVEDYHLIQKGQVDDMFASASGMVPHNHDDRYYTETEADVFHDQLDDKIDTTSGTLQYNIDNLIPGQGRPFDSLVRTTASGNDFEWQRRATEEFSIAMSIVFGGR